ncbi:non-homologous end-joining DNA ligase [Maribacter polysaccharolyticus]|uniref:non-homologous end-joining DNA ligase n=1 Tax=Maribacter polysaccharolyticus TaxID=3020831 RepID=UPI00237F1E58|nr:non-homologous end-joining DNA ligase [Maribacter polysaccharolyticus]MDE3742547.1 non-homologous end-joining DNA ligase [Maribacter polysaccharolyticus]
MLFFKLHMPDKTRTQDSLQLINTPLIDRYWAKNKENKESRRVKMMQFIQKSQNEKVLFPVSGITKGNLIDYYRAISEFMWPYLKDRPLTLHRHHNGIAEQGIFQKNTSEYFPDWIQTMKIRKKNRWVNHVICNDIETLAFLAYQNTITFHVTLSKTDKLEYPDRLIFDLDPPGYDFAQVQTGVRLLREFLTVTLGLPAYVMLTGSKGVHLVIPLMRMDHFIEVGEFAKKVAEHIVEKYPETFTVAHRKNQRKGLIFIDYLRNSHDQTVVCPYSIRGLENAPVAMPITWKELDTTHSSQAYTIKNTLERMTNGVDPWKDFAKNSVILSDAKKKMELLIHKKG